VCCVVRPTESLVAVKFRLPTSASFCCMLRQLFRMSPASSRMMSGEVTCHWLPRSSLRCTRAIPLRLLKASGPKTSTSQSVFGENSSVSGGSRRAATDIQLFSYSVYGPYTQISTHLTKTQPPCAYPHVGVARQLEFLRQPVVALHDGRRLCHHVSRRTVWAVREGGKVSRDST